MHISCLINSNYVNKYTGDFSLKSVIIQTIFDSNTQ